MRTLSVVAIAALVGPVLASPGDVFEAPVPVLGSDPPKERDIGDGDASVSTQTGALNYSFPIEVPPGRLVEPTLALTYSSSGALYGSSLGAGWQLSIPEIRRDPAQSQLGMQESGSTERWISSMSGGNRLVEVTEPHQSGVAFRAQYDSSYTRYEHTPAQSWVARTTDGLTYRLGEIANMEGGIDITWSPLTSIEDPFGNTVRYFYVAVRNDSNAVMERVLSRIEYTTNARAGLNQPHAQVLFDYSTPDSCALTGYGDLPNGARIEQRAGQARWVGARRLDAIRTQVQGATGWRAVRTITLGYDAQSEQCGRDHGPVRLLTSIRESATSPTGVVTTMPPATFDYGPTTPLRRVARNFSQGLGPFPDALHAGIRRATWSSWPELETMLLDFDGDGRLDRIIASPDASGCAFQWERNEGNRFAAPSAKIYFPAFHWGNGSGGSTSAADCSLSGQRSFFQNRNGNPACPGSNLGHYVSYRFLDMNGDGLPDLVTGLQADGRYFNPDLEDALPAGWDLGYTCQGFSGLRSWRDLGGACPDLAPGALDGAETCPEETSCQLDLERADEILRRAPRVACGDLMERAGSSSVRDGTSSAVDDDPPPPSCARRNHVQQCGQYLWVIFWNQGNGVLATSQPNPRLNPVPLESNQYDTGLGGAHGFSSSTHAIMDIDGDGLLDAVTVSGENTSAWYVFRGNGFGSFAGHGIVGAEPYLFARPESILLGDSFKGWQRNPDDPAPLPDEGVATVGSFGGVMDVSGDGLPDLLYRPTGSTTVRAYVSLGDRFQYTTNNAEHPSWYPHLNFAVAEDARSYSLNDDNRWIASGNRLTWTTPIDYDGDGRLDLYVRRDPESSYDGNWNDDEGDILTGNGAGALGASVDLVAADRDGVSQHIEASIEPESTFRVLRDFVDLNGDSVTEYVRWDSASSRFVYLTDQELLDGMPARLLHGIDNGAGGVTQVRYRAASDAAIDIPGTDDRLGMPSHTWVVDTITRTDSSDADSNTGSATATTTYRYGRPIYNLAGTAEFSSIPLDLRARYGFRGFDRVRETSPLGAVTDSVYAYDVDWSGRLVETAIYATAADLTAGRPSSIEQTAWNTFPLFDGDIENFHPTDVRTWRCSAGQDRPTCLASGALRVESTEWFAKAAEADTSPIPLVLLYFPRVTWKKKADAVQDYDRRYFNTNALYSGSDFYRLRLGTENTHERVNGTLEQRGQRVHFWSADSLGRDGAFENAVRDHLETGVTATTQKRDDLALGLVTARRKPRQYEAGADLWLTTAYDAAYPVHPISTQNELGHVVTTRHDLGTGALLEERGPNAIACGSGCTEQEGTETVVDGFGRPLEVYAWTEDPADATFRKVLVERFTYFDRNPATDGAPRMVREEKRVDWNGTLFTQTETEYDGFGRVMKRQVTRSETPNVVERFLYDAQGNLDRVGVRDPRVDTQANVAYFYDHDALDRITQIRRPDNTRIQWSYDGLATRRVEVAATGPEAETTSTTDVFGRMSTVDERIDATTVATTIYEWDANDNLKKMTAPDGAITTLEHDWVSRRMRIRRGSRLWQYTYDRNGNMLTETPPFPDGEERMNYVTSTTYDALDRPVTHVPAVRASPDWVDEFAGAITYQYDQGQNGIGRLTRVSTTAWDRTFAHDARGNVVSDALHFNLQPALGAAISDTRTMQRAFNPLGGVVDQLYGDGTGQTGSTRTTTTYDRRGLPKTLTWQVQPTPVLLATATWNGAGLMTGLGAGAVNQTWTYDEVGRVLTTAASSSQMAGAPQIRETWTYYGADDPQTLTTQRAGLPSRTFTFNFDDRHQLDSAWDNQSTYSSAFDYRADGRLETATVTATLLAPAREVEYVYPTALETTLDPHAVKELRNQNGSSYMTYGFDSAGNVTARNGVGSNFQFLYDGDDQQRLAIAQSSDEVYYYDHEGKRFLAVSRGGGGAISKVRLWHGALEVEYSAQGQPTRTVVDLSLGQPVARIENRTTAKRVVHGRLGHFLGAFTSNNQALDVAFLYGPFGEILAQSGASAAYTERFNGKEQDQLTSLSYYGARYFDPISLTWTQADPLYRFAPDAAWDQPRRANLYSFTLNNPLRYTDPDGEQAVETMGAACTAAPLACGTAVAIAAPVVAVAALVYFADGEAGHINPAYAGCLVSMSGDSACGDPGTVPADTVDPPEARPYQRPGAGNEAAHEDKRASDDFGGPMARPAADHARGTKPRGPKGGVKHTPGRGHTRKSDPARKERFRKKKERERREAADRMKKLQDEWNSMSAEAQKIHGSFEKWVSQQPKKQ